MFSPAVDLSAGQDGRWAFASRFRPPNGLKRPFQNEHACLEFETEVADRDQMHEAIQRMGFYPAVRIVKTRRTCRVDDPSLCLDYVDHLGPFLEVEKIIGPGQSGEAMQADLHAVA